MEIAFGLLILLAAFIAMVGWAVPLVWGIVLLAKRRSGSTGIVLTVVGGLWAIVGIAMIGFAIYGFRQAMQYSSPKEFDPSGYSGTVGTVNLSYKGDAKLTVAGKDNGKPMALVARNGSAVAPVGIYRLISFEGTAMDGAGKEWTLSSFWLDGRQELNLQATTHPTLSVAEGLTARATASRGKGDKVDVSLQVADAQGRSYSLTKSNGREPISFVMLSPSGQKLWEGKFEYG